MSKAEYDRKYVKEHLKRISLNMQLADYERLQKYAEKANETISGYIKKAIQMREESEQI